MLEIEYKGANTVVVTTKKATIVTDSKLSVVGLSDIKIKDSVELATEDRLALNYSEAKVYINGPGEYGVGDCDIVGVSAQRHLDSEQNQSGSTMYRVSVGDVHVAIIGNIYENLSDNQLEALGVIDILLIPIGGGGYTLDATGASTLIKKIGPKVVIPIHFADKGLKYEVPQDELEMFTSEMSAPVQTLDKYKLKNESDLPQVLNIIVLNR